MTAATYPPCGTMTVAEAARAMGVGESTAYRNARQFGQIEPGVPVLPSFSRSLRVPRVAVERYMTAQVVPEDRDETHPSGGGVLLPSSTRRSKEPSGACATHPSGEVHDDDGRAVA